MTKQSHEHHSDEFGQSTSGGIRGLDAPMIGAASSIMLEGIVEQESGVTPQPPVVSMKAMVIGLIAMFVFGAVMLFVVVPLLPSTVMP